MIRSPFASRLGRFAPFALLAFASLLLGPALPPAVAQPPSALSPLESASTGGFGALDRALARLAVHERVLVVAAHPDDEDTSLLTLIARGYGGESAYLSLSRGEGGQNLIGPELGVGLGLIRTRELLAARRVDGARQFFTRAFDFGYTRSIEETFRFWPKDEMLLDAVRIVRRFRPQVIVSIFRGEPHRNHGQHQVAGWTAYEAFRAAGDGAFSGLAGEDLAPWQPTTLYRSSWFDDKEATVKLSIAPIDPVTGKSILQLASASRSQHRSQDMGRTQDLGGRETSTAWVAGGAGKEGAGLFAGIDTRLSAIAAGLPEGETRKKVEEKLAAVQATAEQLRKTLSPARMGDAVAPLARVLSDLSAARGLVGTAPSAPGERAAADFLDEKIAIASEALAAAAGVAFDAWTERETYNPGATVAVAANLWPAGGTALEGARVSLVPSAAWGTPEVAGEAKELAAGALGEWKLETAVPAGAPPTLPYFLRKPMNGALYDWSDAPAAVRGEPFEPAPLSARASFRIAGVDVALNREVVLRVRDQALGEIRRPLRVVPPVEVAIDQDRLVWALPKGKAGAKAPADSRTVRVELISRSPKPVAGKLRGALPAPWKSPAPIPFAFAQEGEKRAVELKLDLPANLPAGAYPLSLSAELDGGGSVELAVPTIEYPHIRPTPMPKAARIEVRAVDLALPKLDRVGYVRGASDRVPEALIQVGLPVQMLGAAELAEGDLSRYDAIVIGSRAYESEPSLVAANPRLLDYARAGGLLIVQYQQYPFVEGKFAPFPFDIARPHDRVTDETAPVRLLDPAHPVFNSPNPIGAADWEGWVQERGLYFAHTWDPAYTPLLAMTDPGEPEQEGGLLLAKLGQGTYVYSGLAFFRELPAGVPGGFRLFANVLGLARPKSAR